jgi:protease I
MEKLNEKTIALIATNGFEDQELRSPKRALEEAGAKVDVLSLEPDPIRAWKEKGWGDTVDVTRVVSSANANEYDALMLPGGVINADTLRGTRDVARLVGEFFQAGKPIAAICHAPWILIEAGKLEGRRMTSYFSLKTDLRNAGAQWVDEAAVEDGNLLTSRTPKDLPQFNEKMIRLFATWEPRAIVGDVDQSEIEAEAEFEVDAEAAGDVAPEDELDRLAKMREDSEGPAPRLRKPKKEAPAPQAPAFDDDTARAAREPATASGEDVDTSDIEGSAQMRGMGSKGSKFTGSSRNRRSDDIAIEGATRRGTQSTVRKTPEASRGTSSPFSARSKRGSTRRTGGKRKPERK